jgi:hypothetical protein
MNGLNVMCMTATLSSVGLLHELTSSEMIFVEYDKLVCCLTSSCVILLILVSSASKGE